MTLLSAWWALAALLAAPIILLYLLKMRRTPTVIASTLLWQQALADMRANTPFQKLRRNLLLLLQLLILALLVFALCRPIIRAVGRRGSEIVVILDASASMQTTDGPSGESRFEYAVAQVDELIDNLRRGDRMMLIVAGPSGAGERTPLTASATELRRALRRAKPFDTSAATTDALRLAAATLAGEQRGTLRGEVYLVSDGVSVVLPDTAGLIDALRYVRVGSAVANVGITSLSVEAAGGGRQRILVGVQNFGPDPAAVEVSFYFGERSNWIDTRTLRIEPARRGEATVEIALPPGKLWVRLQASDDQFELDNIGYAVVPDTRLLHVRLVSDGNPVLSRFLAAAAGEGHLRAETTAPADYTAAMAADLTIFDGVAPPAGGLPGGDVLMFDLPAAEGDSPAAAAGFTRIGDLDAPGVLSAASEDEILRFVNLAELKIARAGRYTHDGAATELIAAADGPLLAYTQDGPSRRYLVAFHLADSTWSTDPGVLILLSNIIDHTGRVHFVGRSQLLPTGEPAALPPGVAATEVTDPDGHTHTVDAGINRFAATTAAGFYTATRGDLTRAFAANLLSPIESDIAPRSLAAPNASATVTGADSVAQTNRPLWPLLAAAALAVLMIEWYCYHRRIGQ